MVSTYFMFLSEADDVITDINSCGFKIIDYVDATDVKEMDIFFQYLVSRNLKCVILVMESQTFNNKVGLHNSFFLEP